MNPLLFALVDAVLTHRLGRSRNLRSGWRGYGGHAMGWYRVTAERSGLGTVAGASRKVGWWRSTWAGGGV